jgi:hypothetical protein
MPGPAQLVAPVLTDNSSVQELNPNGGAVTNQLPSLKVQGEISRSQITSFNVYKNLDNQKYSAQHPNAQHDGDIYGRGELAPGGGVGTSIDTMEKNTLLYSSGNKYKPGSAGSNYYNFSFGEQYW